MEGLRNDLTATSSATIGDGMYRWNWPAPDCRIVILAFVTTVAACHPAHAPVERIALDKAAQGPEAPIASPDTKAAAWTASTDGQRLDFGNPGAKPFLTLECRAGAMPAVRIIRHVVSRPGESALFPVLGSGPNARFKLDAANVGGEWAWAGDVPVSDPQLEVFHSGRLEATLPGGGSLIVPASPVPGEFVSKCRGSIPIAAASDAAEPSSPEPAE